jgi:hypothetical protein
MPIQKSNAFKNNELLSTSLICGWKCDAASKVQRIKNPGHVKYIFHVGWKSDAGSKIERI